MPDDNQTTQPNTTDPLATANPAPIVPEPVTPPISQTSVIPEVPETKPETSTEPLPSFINTDSSVPTPPPVTQEETSPFIKPVVEEQSSMPEETPPIIQDGSSAPSFDIPPVITPPEKPKAKLGGKVIATILGILLLVGGIGTGLYLVGQQQDLNKRAQVADTCGPGIGVGDKACLNNTDYGTCQSTGYFTGQTTCPSGQLCRGASCVKPAGDDTGNDTPTDTSGGTKKCDDGIAERANGYISCLDNAQPAKCNGSNRNWDPQAHCSVGSICVVGSGCQTCTEAQKAAHNGCDFAASVTETGSDTTNTTGGGTSCMSGTPTCVPDDIRAACNEAGEWCKAYHWGELGWKNCSACTGKADGSTISGVCDGAYYCITGGGVSSCIKNTSCNWSSQQSNPAGEQCGPDTTGTCKGTTTNTITPPTDTPICQNIKAYDTSWNALTADQLKTLKVGDVVKLTVEGANGTFDKAQFKINGAATWTERTDKKPSTEEFFIDYTIPAGITTFNVEAQVHVTGGVWK